MELHGLELTDVVQVARMEVIRLVSRFGESGVEAKLVCLLIQAVSKIASENCTRQGSLSWFIVLKTSGAVCDEKIVSNGSQRARSFVDKRVQLVKFS